MGTKTWSALCMATTGLGLAVVFLAGTWTGAVAMSGYGLVAVGIVGLVVTAILWWRGSADASRRHHGDEFGQPASGKLTGLDAPFIGAPTGILIDGIVESESGRTPSPPPFSVKAAAIGLVVMFLLGLVLLWAGLTFRQGTLDSENATVPVQRVTTYDPASDRTFRR